MAIRRLQGTLKSDDGELDGAEGVAVLMRYTLRLLTAQHFQRAAALIAACEVLRRARLGSGDARFGATPFRLGLWIGGSSTPNTTASAHEAIRTARQRQGKTGSYADPLKLASCPWCGTALSIEKDVDADKVRARTIFACPDSTFACALTKRNSNGEGLPIVTVDEEIYVFSRHSSSRRSINLRSCRARVRCIRYSAGSPSVVPAMDFARST